MRVHGDVQAGRPQRQVGPAAASKPVVRALGVQRGLIQPRGRLPLAASSAAMQRSKSRRSSASSCVAGMTSWPQPCAATGWPAAAIACGSAGWRPAKMPLT